LLTVWPRREAGGTLPSPRSAAQALQHGLRRLADVGQYHALPGARQGHIELARVVANEVMAFVLGEAHAPLLLEERVDADQVDSRASLRALRDVAIEVRAGPHNQQRPSSR